MWLKLASATFSTNLGKMSDLSNSISIKYDASGFSYTTGSVSKDAASASLILTLNSNYTYEHSNSNVTVTGATKGTTSYSSGTLTIPITPSSGSTFGASGASSINVTVTGAVSSGGEPETPDDEPETPVTPINYTFTINPTPTSATVTLSATGYSTVSGTGSQSIAVANGTKVNWSVSADGYTTRTGNWTANGSDESKTVLLDTKINTPPTSDAPSGNLASPLVNINMADGTNIGTGGATYNASAIMDGAFSNNTFTCSNATGAMTVPIDFITDKDSEFTAYMVFDSWEYSDARYQRFFRYKGDEPALYISHSYKMPSGGYTGAQHKLLNAGLKASNLEYRDENYWLEISEGAAVCMDMEALSKPLAVAIRNDGVRYSFWVNGKCISTQLLTGKPSSPDWSEFQIGSGDDSGYNLQSLTCSKLMIWDKPLSDEEMATLLPN